MMRVDARTVVRKLKRRYGNLRPEEMCRELGILIREMPMGDCRGFFLRQSRIKLIMLNSDLEDNPRKIVLCHELGHGVLHAATGSACRFHDAGLFDVATMCEREANEFAAEYLLEDDEVLGGCENGASVFQLARDLSVPPELLNVKCRILRREGFDVNIPMQARNEFMGKAAM